MSLGFAHACDGGQEVGVEVPVEALLLGVPLEALERERDVGGHRCVAHEDVLLGRADIEDANRLGVRLPRSYASFAVT